MERPPERQQFSTTVGRLLDYSLHNQFHRAILCLELGNCEDLGVQCGICYFMSLHF
jgi:hypothetical protein